ncbi:MAG: Hsp20/alpha crystallin family protein [Dehalococcoidia bacterium]
MTRPEQGKIGSTSWPRAISSPIDDNALIVRAKTRKSAAKQDELMSSHLALSFTRVVQFHNAADEDKMTSADTNRVLTITLMK